jgi:hypothetical protein
MNGSRNKIFRASVPCFRFSTASRLAPLHVSHLVAYPDNGLCAPTIQFTTNGREINIPGIGRMVKYWKEEDKLGIEQKQKI